MRKTLEPEDVVAIVDTREQTPLDLSPLKTARRGLDTGDYSVVGLQDQIAIERKSLPDLLLCVGKERERFDRECRRMLAYQTRAIVVEATWEQIKLGEWRSKVRQEAVFGSLMGWLAMGLPIIMAGNHVEAGRFVSRILFIAARRKWQQLYPFLESRL